ncbi:MAG: peptidase T [Candidatus Bipolaricaulota bacterium]
MNEALRAKLEERLVRYARVATQSDDASSSVPTTPGQLDLQRMLLEELRRLGVADVRLNDAGFLLATLPSTVNAPAPVVGLLAHVDTAMDFAAHDVKPIVHRNYDGRVIRLPGDPAVTLDPKEDPALAARVGDTIVTADGTTLLGADDKAGVAVLVTLVEHLLADPSIPHGKLRFAFTPDEETGTGIGHLELAEFGADVAYTLDGEGLGEVTYETFSADRATVRIRGVAIHAGIAKGKMVNALTLAAKLVSLLPHYARSPETTDGRDGFLHVVRAEGTAAEATLDFILRDFELEGLEALGRAVKAAADAVAALEPRAAVECTITRQYRNMRYVLENDMRPAELALEAVRRTGVEPKVKPARGGTDGSQLTERGLPTPDLFAGVHNPHGPREWASVLEMEKSLEACVQLVSLWAQEKPA